MDTNDIFCPVCKKKNERNSAFCKHCGTSLGYYPGEVAPTTVNTGGFEKDGVKLPDPISYKELTPADGIAIYVSGTAKPIYLHFDKELIFGRTTDQKFDASLLDLTDLGGFQMGISRHHAVINRTEDGYTITDLSSTNGSWLNNERLIPNKPYTLASGSQLRFGRMQFLILYQPTKKTMTHG